MLEFGALSRVIDAIKAHNLNELPPLLQPNGALPVGCMMGMVVLMAKTFVTLADGLR